MLLSYTEGNYFYKYVQTIHGAEKGEPAAMLLSSSNTSHTVAADYSRHGSLFTLFLTAPLHAFCLLLGISASDVEMVMVQSLVMLYLKISSLFQTIYKNKNGTGYI